jgi:mannose-6-phosphate isomerase-like protein (cupin superfamily)
VTLTISTISTISTIGAIMHITNDDRPTFELGPTTFLGGAAPSRGSETTALWTVTVAGRVDEGMPHRLDQEEVFLVLDGRPTLSVGDEQHACRPGDVVVVAPDTLLALSNPGDDAATLVVAIPNGFRATGADGTEIGTPPWAR